MQDEGINAACDQAVYRIDVGLSKGCGDGHPEVSLAGCCVHMGIVNDSPLLPCLLASLSGIENDRGKALSKAGLMLTCMSSSDVSAFGCGGGAFCRLCSGTCQGCCSALRSAAGVSHMHGWTGDGD